MPLPMLLLPGMDGTGRLFKWLTAELPPHIAPRLVSYRTDEPLGYRDLERRIELPNEPFAIVAESFSGPLAIRIAAKRPKHLRAVVLAATFVRSQWVNIRVPRGVFAVDPPAFVLKLLLTKDEDVLPELKRAIRSVSSETMAHRLRDILSVNVATEFSEIEVPLLYIGGSKDRIVPRRAVTEMSKLQPSMKVAFLDAPHLVLQSRPAEAARLIVNHCK